MISWGKHSQLGGIEILHLLLVGFEELIDGVTSFSVSYSRINNSNIIFKSICILHGTPNHIPEIKIFIRLSD